MNGYFDKNARTIFKLQIGTFLATNIVTPKTDGFKRMSAIFVNFIRFVLRIDKI